MRDRDARRIALFHEHYDINEDGCWIWNGKPDKGYGKFVGGMAHRWAYEYLVGPIPAGLQLDHLCRVTLCVNPRHLEPVDQFENMRRRYSVQVACKHGHPFDEANTYIRPTGHRQCRQCNLHSVVQYHARLVGKSAA